MSTPVHEYDVKTDGTRRVILRAAYDDYHVREYDDGSIRLEPRELRAAASLSRRVLSHMDEAMRAFARRGGRRVRAGGGARPARRAMIRIRDAVRPAEWH